MFYAFFEFDAVERHVAAAAEALQPDNTSDAYYLKAVRAAGVRLFQLYYVAGGQSDYFQSYSPSYKHY